MNLDLKSEFKLFKKKYFPELKNVRLKIIRENTPTPGVRTIAGFSHKKTIYVKSWTKKCDHAKVRAILLHELTHASLESQSYLHGKSFAKKLVGIYKEEFPTSYKKRLREEFWLTKSDAIVNGKFIPPKFESGLVLSRYHKLVKD